MLNHQSFGGSSFIQIAIGVNLGVKGVGFFRAWLQDLYGKCFGDLKAKFASALDRSDSNGAVKAIKQQQLDTDQLSTVLFRLFSAISWASIIYGIIALFLNVSHCSHLLLILVWPLYVVVVWCSAKWQARSLNKKLENWDQIQRLADEGGLEQQLSELDKKVQASDDAQKKRNG